MHDAAAHRKLLQIGLTVITTLVLAVSAMGLLTSCNDPDAKARKRLRGVWVCEFDYPEGGSFTSTSTISASGDYVCQAVIRSPGAEVRTFELKGNMRITGAFLSDVVTNYSISNASLPLTNHHKITRMTDTEMVVSVEGRKDASVFRKVR